MEEIDFLVQLVLQLLERINLLLNQKVDQYFEQATQYLGVVYLLQEHQSRVQFYLKNLSEDAMFVYNLQILYKKFLNRQCHGIQKIKQQAKQDVLFHIVLHILNESFFLERYLLL
jgi:hypothetical protein